MLAHWAYAKTPGTHAIESVLLSQHNFEFRSVSRIYGQCGGAGLISISYFTAFLPILEGISVENSKLR